MLRRDEQPIPSTATILSDLSTDHMAVVVLCAKADAASLRTIQECTQNFATHQIYVVEYSGQVNNDDDNKDNEGSLLHLSLQTEGLLERVNYVPCNSSSSNNNNGNGSSSSSSTSSWDKCKALKHVCASTLAHYTHILLVDAQVGVRHELLHDGLSQSMNISTCVYFGKALSSPPSTAATSSSSLTSPVEHSPTTRARMSALVRQRLLRNAPPPPLLFRKSSSTTTSSSSSPSSIMLSTTVMHHPTFADKINEGMPNHFLDLWERTTLFLYLQNLIDAGATSIKALGESHKNNSNIIAVHPDFLWGIQSTPCSLQRAIDMSRSLPIVSRSSSTGEWDRLTCNE